MKICANCGLKQGERVGRYMMEKPPAVEVGEGREKGQKETTFFMSINLKDTYFFSND